MDTEIRWHHRLIIASSRFFMFPELYITNRSKGRGRKESIKKVLVGLSVRLTKWTLVVVIIGLLFGMVGTDIDHLLITTDGGLSISNIECIWQAFISLHSNEAKACMLNQEFGYAFLHEWFWGLFFVGFIGSYYVVMKNE